jgi:hypothetical protein
VTRDRHPAVCTSPEAVSRSRDQGCNGHWILRRVPIDGRHPGSSRGAFFHETASTVISAVSASSDPYKPPQRRLYGHVQLLRRWERREGEPKEIATGVSEARSHQRRGKKTPTLVHLLNSVARPKSTSLSVACRSAEAVFGRRETSGPPVSRTEPKTPWDVRAAKVARVNREHTRCGCT